MKLRNFEKLFSGTLIAIIAASPIFFGSVHPWSYGIESCAVFILFALWLLQSIKAGRITVSYTAILWLLPLAVIFFILQALPLPSSIVRAVSHGRAAVDAAAGSGPGTESLALYPWGVEQQAFILTAALLIFLMVISLVRKKEQIKRFLAVLYLTGLALAAFALMQRVAINSHWFLPFINKNHFAGYMELLVPLSVSALVYHMGKIKKKESLKETLLELSSSPSGARIVFFLFLAVLFSVCIVLTYSRGGIGGLVVSLAVVTILLGKNKKTAAIAALCGLVIIFLVFRADEGGVAGRMQLLVDGADPSALLRVRIWDDTARMIKAFPATGVGLGGFETAYPYFKSNDIQMNFFQPESDYLYILAEGGLIGFSLAAAFLFFYFFETWRRFRDRKDFFSKSVYAGAVAGLSGLLFHGFVDTSLHMPSILFTCSAILGLGYVSVSLRFKYPSDPEKDKYQRKKNIGLASFQAKAVAAVCIFMALVASAAATASAGADIMYRFGLNMKSRLAIDGAPSREDYEEMRGKFNGASVLDPLCAQYKFERGMAEQWLAEFYSAKESIQGRKDGSSREYYGLALNSFRGSLKSNPYSSFEHLVAGRIMERGFGLKEEREREFQAAFRLNPTNKFIQEQVKRISGGEKPNVE